MFVRRPGGLCAGLPSQIQVSPDTVATPLGLDATRCPVQLAQLQLDEHAELTFVLLHLSGQTVYGGGELLLLLLEL